MSSDYIGRCITLLGTVIHLLSPSRNKHTNTGHSNYTLKATIWWLAYPSAHCSPTNILRRFSPASSSFVPGGVWSAIMKASRAQSRGSPTLNFRQGAWNVRVSIIHWAAVILFSFFLLLLLYNRSWLQRSSLGQYCRPISAWVTSDLFRRLRHVGRPSLDLAYITGHTINLFFCWKALQARMQAFLKIRPISVLGVDSNIWYRDIVCVG